jgi:hypothetical protein
MPPAMPLSANSASRVRLFRLPVERTSPSRVKISVGGRLMLEDRSEHGATTLEANISTLVLRTDARSRVGERIIGYFDTIGRLEGRVEAINGAEIVMTIESSVRKRDKIAGQFTWLANRDILNLPEDRRHDRVVPRDPRVSIRRRGDASGVEMRGHLIDVSRSGAGVSVSGQFEMGDELFIGSTPAKVVRRYEGGLAVEFRAPIPDAMFDVDIRL